MLCKRLIVCLDVRDGRVVKGTSFEGLRDVGDPVELAARYQNEGADEIVFLDISASLQGRRTLLDVVKCTAEQLFIPLTVGGGITELADIDAALRAGADKVSVNTAAVQRPELLTHGAQRFGAQCIVASIDARLQHNNAGATVRSGTDQTQPSEMLTKSLRGREVAEAIPDTWYRVFTHGGRNATELDATAWAMQCVSLGAGEVLVTSIDQDGQRNGYDLELTGRIAESVSVPVIASGGAGSPDHLVSAFKLAGADAALVAGMFHDGTYTVPQVKQHLARADIPVRLSGALV
ncbi:MAG: imidazole glycerol phosphate synthase subunit HisF [Gemmatimonadota bacterium]|nr:imidazole glycerol phosphate synthase subunit HisF [Gemmatimonadota bacterium]